MGLRPTQFGPRFRALSLAFSFLAAPALFFLTPPAIADTDPALQRDYDDAFAAMFKAPDNLDAAFRYAEAAVRVGDLEGAVGALERMLIYNPALPRVRLELAALYFKLESFDLARG